MIWYGSPHSPFVASDPDRTDFAELDDSSAHHYGELVAMDRSIGTLRAGLRDMGVAENTLLWFNSDNGGLPRIEPGTVGGLRGFKGSVYEGGLRVPAVIEWPARITEPRVTEHASGTFDIFPTVAEVVGLESSAMPLPVDGVSLAPLFAGEIGPREKPMGFSHLGKAALIDNDWKILTTDVEKGEYEVYNLADDPNETTDLSASKPRRDGPSSGGARCVRCFGCGQPCGEGLPEGRGRSQPSDTHDVARHRGIQAILRGVAEVASVLRVGWRRFVPE